MTSSATSRRSSSIADECPQGRLRTSISPDEIMAAARSQGQGNLDGIDAVVVETDRGFSVIPRLENGTASALSNVQRAGTGRDGDSPTQPR